MILLPVVLYLSFLFFVCLMFTCFVKLVCNVQCHTFINVNDLHHQMLESVCKYIHKHLTEREKVSAVLLNILLLVHVYVSLSVCNI